MSGFDVKVTSKASESRRLTCELGADVMTRDARPILRADSEPAAQVGACREEFRGESRLTRLLGTCH